MRKRLRRPKTKPRGAGGNSRPFRTNRQCASIATAPAGSIFGWRHRAMKCPCLRGEPRIEGDLCKRQSACCCFEHRLLEPKPANIPMWRDGDGAREHARNGMYQARDSGHPSSHCQRGRFHIHRGAVSSVISDRVESAVEPMTSARRPAIERIELAGDCGRLKSSFNRRNSVTATYKCIDLATGAVIVATWSSTQPD